jgi:hypothetical protein
MHTAICTFDDRANAEQAVERLVQAGFDRHDVHLEYRHADGSPMTEGKGDEQGPNDRFDGMEREVALDRSVVLRLGNFFGRLFAHDDAHGHADAYSSAVDRGHCVVIVDGHDEAEAQRAQDLLLGMEAGDLNLVHRPGQRPLRDVVAERQASGMESSFGTARSEMAPSHNMDVRREGEFFPEERTPERAIASQGWGEQRTIEVVDDDKPIASPDLRPGGDDKPR